MPANHSASTQTVQREMYWVRPNVAPRPCRACGQRMSEYWYAPSRGSSLPSLALCNDCLKAIPHTSSANGRILPDGTIRLTRRMIPLTHTCSECGTRDAQYISEDHAPYTLYLCDTCYWLMD